jgi:hypothetical protein
MVVGRLIAGAGVGFISAISKSFEVEIQNVVTDTNRSFTVILYMSEIAPKKVRGALVAGYQL